MLYSHNLDKEKLNLFTLFINKALEGEKAYESIVNDIILEAHLFAVGQKNLYTIHRDSLNIVLLLAELEGEYFSKLPDVPATYDATTYSKVLEILQKRQPSMAY